MAALWVLSLLMVVVACGPASAPPAPGPLSSATVEHVVDGDTVALVIDGQVERVRLLGVDAPESVSRSVPVQCFGPEAGAALAETLPPGTEVRISRDLDARDHYGRLLLYLHRSGDGLFVNLWLVEAGLADAVAYEPNVTYRATFDAARRRAEAQRIGLWGHCDGPDEPLG